MKFRDFIIRRAVHTVITIFIVLILMFVLFRAMPSNPVAMATDPKWGPLQVHEVAMRYGFERDGNDEATYTGTSGQDAVSGNISFIAQDFVKTSNYKDIEVAGGTLWFQVNLTWDKSSTDTLYLGLFIDGSHGAPLDGKPQPEELVQAQLLNSSASLCPYNRSNGPPVFHKLSLGVERPRERINEVDHYIAVVLGYNVSYQVQWKMNFDRLYIVKISMWEQFLIYMKSMLTFDFGRSFYSQRPVMDELGQRVGSTLVLFGTASILGPIFGISIGTILAWRRGTKMELGSIVVSLFFYSMPIFWLGMIMIWVFANQLKWFPLGGMIDTTANYQGLQYVGDVLYHLALPLITMMIAGLAGGILLMRNSMLEVVGEDYITTARAKGLTERKIMYKHAARNAMLPVVTAIAMGVGGAISGGVLTETMFNWPGVGRYLVSSTLQQDYPVVQATFFILALITIISNVVADILYAYLDPRVRI